MPSAFISSLVSSGAGASGSSFFSSAGASSAAAVASVGSPPPPARSERGSVISLGLGEVGSVVVPGADGAGPVPGGANWFGVGVPSWSIRTCRTPDPIGPGAPTSSGGAAARNGFGPIPGTRPRAPTPGAGPLGFDRGADRPGPGRPNPE